MTATILGRTAGGSSTTTVAPAVPRSVGGSIVRSVGGVAKAAQTHVAGVTKVHAQSQVDKFVLQYANSLAPVERAEFDANLRAYSKILAKRFRLSSSRRRSVAIVLIHTQHRLRRVLNQLMLQHIAGGSVGELTDEMTRILNSYRSFQAQHSENTIRATTASYIVSNFSAASSEGSVAGEIDRVELYYQLVNGACDLAHWAAFGRDESPEAFVDALFARVFADPETAGRLLKEQRDNLVLRMRAYRDTSAHGTALRRYVDTDTHTSFVANTRNLLAKNKNAVNSKDAAHLALLAPLYQYVYDCLLKNTSSVRRYTEAMRRNEKETRSVAGGNKLSAGRVEVDED